MAESNLTIQVQIGNRSYPLTIPVEEQEHVLRAAEKINEDLKSFEQKYKVKDQQDLLAMISLQIASEQLKSKVQNDRSQKDVTQGLRKLNQLVTDFLSKP
jgi:cell division protein ZapA (FtsZ GTPase activity inhibitor)